MLQRKKCLPLLMSGVTFHFLPDQWREVLAWIPFPRTNWLKSVLKFSCIRTQPSLTCGGHPLARNLVKNITFANTVGDLKSGTI